MKATYENPTITFIGERSNERFPVAFTNAGSHEGHLGTISDRAIKRFLNPEGKRHCELLWNGSRTVVVLKATPTFYRIVNGKPHELKGQPLRDFLSGGGVQGLAATASSTGASSSAGAPRDDSRRASASSPPTSDPEQAKRQKEEEKEYFRGLQRELDRDPRLPKSKTAPSATTSTPPATKPKKKKKKATTPTPTTPPTTEATTTSEATKKRWVALGLILGGALAVATSIGLESPTIKTWIQSINFSSLNRRLRNLING